MWPVSGDRSQAIRIPVVLCSLPLVAGALTRYLPSLAVQSQVFSLVLCHLARSSVQSPQF